MFAYLSRLFHTLRYIKGIQWYYQLWYRIKSRFISIHWYNKYLNESLSSIDIEVTYILQSKQKEYLGNNSFELIGLKQIFEDTIDWNYQGHGKLWNYHLQYFGYLLDENIPSEERFRLLKNFSEQLLSGSIKPEPYPVSLRVVNTLLFHSRYPIKDKIILEALFKQIDYLANNLEYHLLANHLLENAFSLFISSIYLANKQLFEKSKKLLIAQLEEQVLGDGGHYECSPMYQSVLLSKLFICIEVGRKATWVTDEIVTFLESKASQMLGWINAYSFPDGSWALMNDAAEQVAPTSQSLNDAAKILKISSANTRLTVSGFRKMCGNDWELLIKTGAVQPSYQPGHVHADITSYCLWYKGKQIIVDRGISTYAVSAQRNEERATRSHNTISFNNYNQSDVWGGFRVGKRAEVNMLEDSDTSIHISVKQYFNSNCIHARKFSKIDEYNFVIEDKIYAPASFMNKCNGRIQFASNIPVAFTDDLHSLDNMTIKLMGLYQGVIGKKSYAVSYHNLKNGFCFEYVAQPDSSFTFTFS
jgi:hypothetical protein